LIKDNDGDELPRGKCGEICARGPTITSGYWNLPHVTHSTIKNGWLHTGDVGYIDDDGFVFIVDRLKDMIISGGENIYSSEIENILYLHPAVYQCAVIGLPNEKWGQVVHAIISVKDNINLTTDDLVKHCREYLPSFKIPKTFDIRTETLPMSGAGKILKSELISALSPKI
jgi:long-chain acyl-CoA synthetase